MGCLGFIFFLRGEAALPPLLLRTPVEVTISGEGDNTPDSRNPNSAQFYGGEEDSEEKQSGGV